MLVTLPSSAQEENVAYSPLEVKAGFIYNFAKFVDWPSSAFASERSSFTIVVLDDPEMGEILGKLVDNRTIKGRNIVVFNVKSINSLPQNYHMMFVPKKYKNQIRFILLKTKSKPILTVGDEIEEFCQLGGTFNFSNRLSNFGFEVNKNSSEKSGLVISSKLLSLARLVDEYGKQ